MSEYGSCPDCGGTGGSHYNDCDYDGTNGNIGYSRGASDFARGFVMVLAIIAGLICPPIGCLLLIIFVNM